MHAKIKGVHVNVPHFKCHKNIKSLKADVRKIFEHLSTDEQEVAYNELMELVSSLHKEEKVVKPKDISEE